MFVCLFVCLNGFDLCLICPGFDMGFICFKGSRHEQAFSADFFPHFLQRFSGKVYGIDLNKSNVLNRAESIFRLIRSGSYNVTKDFSSFCFYSLK